MRGIGLEGSKQVKYDDPCNILSTTLTRLCQSNGTRGLMSQNPQCPHCIAAAVVAVVGVAAVVAGVADVDVAVVAHGLAEMRRNSSWPCGSQ